MNILDKIVAAKKLELEVCKLRKPLKLIKKEVCTVTSRSSFYEALAVSGPSLICEFKRKSPSKGEINPDARIERVVKDYETAGASAVSVLTDVHFGGEIIDLKTASGIVNIPLLRKDFIIDDYQIWEALISGASAILLIAAVLSSEKVREFTLLARELKLDVLLELHSENELDHINEFTNIVGINNRDLTTFKVDIENSIRLSEKLPPEVIKVAESGIDNPEMVKHLAENGFDAFLIGENFMKANDPGKEAADFISSINK